MHLLNTALRELGNGKLLVLKGRGWRSHHCLVAGGGGGRGGDENLFSFLRRYLPHLDASFIDGTPPSFSSSFSSSCAMMIHHPRVRQRVDEGLCEPEEDDPPTGMVTLASSPYDETHWGVGYRRPRWRARHLILPFFEFLFVVEPIPASLFRAILSHRCCWCNRCLPLQRGRGSCRCCCWRGGRTMRDTTGTDEGGGRDLQLVSSSSSDGG